MKAGIEVGSVEFWGDQVELLEFAEAEAPVAGYTPVFERAFIAGQSEWKSGHVVTFYFRSGNSYGKAVLEIAALSSEREVPVNFSGILNPDGSRRLGGN